MKNEEVSSLLERMAFLLELAGENPFKIKAFLNAARVIEELTEEAQDLHSEGKLAGTKGIGKGILAFLDEAFKGKNPEEYVELQRQFPDTIHELTLVRGLGPKKAKALFKELGIGSLAELEYACTENRLVDLKGFGLKTQENILAGIAQIKANRGKVLLPVAEHELAVVLNALPERDCARLEPVGEIARTCEVVSALEFLVVGEPPALPAASPGGLPIRVHRPASDHSLAAERIRLSASPEFWHALSARAGRNAKAFRLATEEEIFRALDLPWLPPELRESPATLKNPPTDLLEEKQIRGVFHLHTTASDGANTLEEMADKCIALGYQYMGVSDHSQTAFYANGLKKDAILSQREEIEALNEKYSSRGFKILQGIESDILAGGELDYPEKVLEKLDFVIASIHGQMNMNPEEMTKRLVRALENPYTSWLGHPTGRLLLGRNGVSCDMEAVIDAAARTGTALELNANPYRLDLDWRHLPYARAKGVRIGIHPDAHSLRGLEDTALGVRIARKGALRARDVTNTLSFPEISAWLRQTREKKLGA